MAGIANASGTKRFPNFWVPWLQAFALLAATLVTTELEEEDAAARAAVEQPLDVAAAAGEAMLLLQPLLQHLDVAVAAEVEVDADAVAALVVYESKDRLRL